LDGVKEGEMVITQGLQKVKTGVEVNPILEDQAQKQKNVLTPSA